MTLKQKLLIYMQACQPATFNELIGEARVQHAICTKEEGYTLTELVAVAVADLVLHGVFETDTIGMIDLTDPVGFAIKPENLEEYLEMSRNAKTPRYQIEECAMLKKLTS